MQIFSHVLQLSQKLLLACVSHVTHPSSRGHVGNPAQRRSLFLPVLNSCLGSWGPVDALGICSVLIISPPGPLGLHSVPRAPWLPSISDAHLVGVFGVPGTCEIRHTLSPSASFLLPSNRVCGPPFWLCRQLRSTPHGPVSHL